MDSPTTVQARLSELLPDLAARAAEEVRPQVGDGDLRVHFSGNVEVGQQQAGGHSVYFVAHQLDLDVDTEPAKLTLTLETVSPDGADATSFLDDELRKIGKPLGADVSLPADEEQ